MRPLRYSINLTLDGCCDHNAVSPNTDVHKDIHQFAAEVIGKADGLLLGRTTYEMMEGAWRKPNTGVWPDWMSAWMYPFAETMDAVKKYVVSSTLNDVDWNSELLLGKGSVDLETAVRTLKEQPGKGLYTGGVKLPMALAELGLIDEYEFLVQPTLVGRGPSLFAGLSKPLNLKLVEARELPSGAVVMRYAREGFRS